MFLPTDVAHTMQHFTVFRKWNQKLFNEMYTAYFNGKIKKDPSESWYAGELGFFDYYSKFLIVGRTVVTSYNLGLITPVLTNHQN